MNRGETIKVKNTDIALYQKSDEDFISLTDIAKYRNKENPAETAWISAEFELYLISEFKRLKAEEQERLSSGWNLQRTLAKINYHIHTDAIKKHLISAVVSTKQKSITYASEADLPNAALFS